MLYSAFTYYAGFRVNTGEYKLMGLAPYGKPRYADAIVERLATLGPDGSIALDTEQHLKSFNFSDFSFDKLTHFEINAAVRDGNVLEVDAHGPSYNGKQFFLSLFSAGQIAALIIARLVQLAEQKIGNDSGRLYDIRKAIITVPANFYDLQIRDVLEACQWAGLDTEDENVQRAKLAKLEEAVKKDPKDVHLRHAVARTLIELGRTHDGEAELRRVLDLAPVLLGPSLRGSTVPYHGIECGKGPPPVIGCGQRLDWRCVACIR